MNTKVQMFSLAGMVAIMAATSFAVVQLSGQRASTFQGDFRNATVAEVHDVGVADLSRDIGYEQLRRAVSTGDRDAVGRMPVHDPPAAVALRQCEVRLRHRPRVVDESNELGRGVLGTADGIAAEQVVGSEVHPTAVVEDQLLGCRGSMTRRHDRGVRIIQER